MHQYKGKLILHTGSMFSGKTSSLEKDLNRFKIANYKVVAYKPSVDLRSSEDSIVTHDDRVVSAVSVDSIDSLIEDVLKNDYEVIGIDEAQFLYGGADKIRKEISKLLTMGKTVVVAGLDMDFNGNAFENIKELMPIADYIYKHHAVCTGCGVDAWVSHRKVNVEDRFLLGAANEYEPLCRTCFEEIKKEEEKLVNKNQIEIDIR